MLGAWGGSDACPSLWNALVAPGAGGRWRRQTAKPNMEAASRWLPGRAGTTGVKARVESLDDWLDRHSGTWQEEGRGRLGVQGLHGILVEPKPPVP